jgi:hypothetical protein
LFCEYSSVLTAQQQLTGILLNEEFSQTAEDDDDGKDGSDDENNI